MLGATCNTCRLPSDEMRGVRVISTFVDNVALMARVDYVNQTGSHPRCLSQRTLKGPGGVIYKLKFHT